jgi:uncharacterized protein (PEP-CTERM system associated)
MAMGMAMAMVQTVLDEMRDSRCAGDKAIRSVLDQGSGDDGRRSGWPRQASASLFGFSLCCLAVPVQAESWQITPTIAVNETLTNNLFLTSTNKTSDLVTAITPGISIDGKGGRASLRLSYGFTQQLYARESSQNNHQNSLSAIGSLEAIENWLFIDATGTISQQYISAFGQTSQSIANVNNNQTETSYYSISPHIKGTFLSSAEYLLRYRAAITRSDSAYSGSTNSVAVNANALSSQGDLNSSEWLGTLSGNTRWSGLGWGLEASRLTNDYTGGRNYEDTRYQAGLNYRFNPQFRVSAFAGQESQNYVSVNQETHTTHGFGFVWAPGPRTELSANNTYRFFGNSYDINFRHRMARSLITYTASRSISSQPAGVGSTGQGSNYDATYAIIAANNPGASPDAIRSQVSQVLQGRGVPADGAVVNGYLTNRPTLQQLQQLSFALLGVRNTVTLNVNETKQQPLGLANGATDDYSLANEITQRGFAIIWGHQLSGLSSLSLSLNQSRSISQRAGQFDNRTQGAYLLLTTQISPKTSASVGARHVNYDGGSISSTGLGSSYTESALTGSLSHSF